MVPEGAEPCWEEKNSGDGFGGVMSTWANVMKAGLAILIGHVCDPDLIQDHSSQGKVQSSQEIDQSLIFNIEGRKPHSGWHSQGHERYNR